MTLNLIYTQYVLSLSWFQLCSLAYFSRYRAPCSLWVLIAFYLFLLSESPMVLDVSLMETTEPPSAVVSPRSDADRDTILYCLPEYQDEIHDYLREAELRFRPKVSSGSESGIFDCPTPKQE